MIALTLAAGLAFVPPASPHFGRHARDPNYRLAAVAPMTADQRKIQGINDSYGTSFPLPGADRQADVPAPDALPQAAGESWDFSRDPGLYPNGN